MWSATCWLALLFVPLEVHAGSIDAGRLEQAWPKQWVHVYTLRRQPVRWRQAINADPKEILTGAEFVAAASPEKVWALTTDYSDVGRMTPGVSAVRWLEDTPSRQVVQVDIKILWKRLRLVFEIEQEAPRAVRFRLVNQRLGIYQGVCLMSPAEPGTRVSFATSFQPVAHVPDGLIVWAERHVILHGIHNFLTTCEAINEFQKTGDGVDKRRRGY